MKRSIEFFKIEEKIIIRKSSFKGIFKTAGKRQILSLIILNYAVAMVTDFQRKSRKLQCSGNAMFIVHVSNSCHVK